MIRINCPFCGLRDHAEFQYIGDSTKIRPIENSLEKQEEWFDFVYIRNNPKGPHQEYWQHTYGCRSFVKVLRNTLTHEIIATGLPEDTLDSNIEPGD